MWVAADGLRTGGTSRCYGRSHTTPDKARKNDKPAGAGLRDSSVLDTAQGSLRDTSWKGGASVRPLASSSSGSLPSEKQSPAALAASRSPPKTWDREHRRRLSDAPRRTPVYYRLSTGSAVSTASVPLRTMSDVLQSPTSGRRSAKSIESVESSRSSVQPLDHPHRPPVLEPQVELNQHLSNAKEAKHRRTSIQFGFLVAFALPFYDGIMHLLTPDVDHWCARPEHLSGAITDKWKEYHLPKTEDGKYSRCEIFKGDPTKTSKIKVPCSKWEYATDYGITIAREWNLVCNRSWLAPAGSYLFVLGSASALPLSGHMADWRGRRPVIKWAVITLESISIAIVFSPNLHIFLVLRFFLGAAVATLFASAFVLLIENVDIQQRSTCGIALHLGYAAGSTTVALLSYFRFSWRLVELIAAVPASFVLFTFTGLAESPHWLFTSTKLQYPGIDPVSSAHSFRERIITFLHAAKVPFYSYESAKIFKSSLQMIDEHGSKVASLFVCWIAVSMTYETAVESGPEIQVHLLLFAVLEFPAIFAAFFITGRYDRHSAQLFAFLCPTFVSIVACLCVEEVLLFKIAIATLQTCCFTTTVLLLLYTSEIYPTLVRCTGLGTSSAVGRLASLGTPLLLSLGRSTDERLALLLVTLFCLVAGLLSYRLPDTKGFVLVDTVKELSQQPSRNGARSAKGDEVLGSLDDTSRLAQAGKEESLLRRISGLITPSDNNR